MNEIKRLIEKIDEVVKSNQRLTDEQIKQRRDYEDQIFNLDEDNIRSITADKINFTTSQFTVSDNDGETLLQVGNKKVKIAGFNVDKNSLYHGNTFSSSDLFLCAGGSEESFSVAGSGAKTGWVFHSGTKFGILNDGVIWCKGANIGNSTIRTATIRTATISDATISDAEIGTANIKSTCKICADIIDGVGVQFGASYNDIGYSDCKMFLDDISDGYSGGTARGIRFRSKIDRVSPMNDDISSLVINPMGIYFTDEITGAHAGENGIGIMKQARYGTVGVGMGYNGIYLWIDGEHVCTNATVLANQSVPIWLENSFT